MDNNKRPTAVIFSQGDEVITGATVDTNAAFLADKCRLLGFDIIRHITVADDMDVLVQTLQDIDQIADMCLCTGGLGPTQDDLTTEAFAKAFDVPLVFDETAYQMMAKFFTQLNLTMPEVNRKQAYLPAKATRIDNHWGTAAGFVSDGHRCRFYCMPGVPYEMENMLSTFVLQDLQQHFSIAPTRLVTLRTMGMGESTIQQKINELNIPAEVRISFRAGLPENELKLTFPHAYDEQQLLQCVDRVKQALGEAVYAIDGLGQSVVSLADCVDQLMRAKGLSLTALETLSQGGFAKQCQADWLRQTYIYPVVDNVANDFAFQHRGVNETTSLAIANQLLLKAPSDIAVVQLFCENQRSEVDIYTSVVSSHGSLSTTRSLTGRLQRIQINAAAACLNLLRKHLLTL
ncbi:MAG: competence/damage-inducible protein A [Piscirickettsiaceae bacterium]|nr:MAG: competence/damage-inducible protein A [Piscirickettsiaceae bacterium]